MPKQKNLSNSINIYKDVNNVFPDLQSSRILVTDAKENNGKRLKIDLT